MTKRPRYRLLIIEDDQAIMRMLRSFFVANDFEVFTAEDGRTGLDHIYSLLPDIIILDVVLPYINGFAIVKKLRRESNHVPVILLTERSGVDEKVEGFDRGADDYLTKPFSTKELLARVNRLLRRLNSDTRSHVLDPISVGPLVISPRTREVLLSEDQAIPLTKTEFDLLYFLAKRKKQIATHGDLLENVLGYKADSETKALVMHIANIRRKLNDNDASDVQIKAITGVGYMLVE